MSEDHGSVSRAIDKTVNFLGEVLTGLFLVMAFIWIVAGILNF